MFPNPHTTHARPAQAGFTLLELLLALSIMVMATTVAFLTFSTVSRAWQRGQRLTDFLNEGDLVMEQIVAGLRSAYFPDSARGTMSYGFWLDDEGGGDMAEDGISWVKLGDALLDPHAPESRAPHRIRLTFEQDDRGRPALAIRAWRPYAQPDDFDPEKLDPMFLSTRVVGLDCEIATNAVEEKLEWETDWEETNRLPAAIKITLYIEPLEDGDKPTTITRAVGIPIAPLSWQ